MLGTFGFLSIVLGVHEKFESVLFVVVQRKILCSPSSACSTFSPCPHPVQSYHSRALRDCRCRRAHRSAPRSSGYGRRKVEVLKCFNVTGRNRQSCSSTEMRVHEKNGEQCNPSTCTQQHDLEHNNMTGPCLPWRCSSQPKENTFYTYTPRSTRM